MLKKTIAVFLLASVCVLSVSAKTPDTVSKTETFTAKKADATYSFSAKTEIDGRIYEQIGDTTYRVVSSKPILKEDVKHHTIESKPMLQKEMVPAQTVTVDGLVYQLDSVQYRDAQITDRAMTLTAYTEWREHIGEPSALKSKTVTYQDTDAGVSGSVELPLLELTQTTPTAWRTEAARRITFSIVNASFFKLGDQWVEYNPALPNLEKYETELISLMGFETGTYRVIRSAWDGDEYEKGGKMCRDALVYGEKYCATYRATYADTVSLTDKAGYIGVAQYTATTTVPTGETEYTIEATATYAPIDDFPIVPVVSVGGVTVMGIVFLGWWFGRKPIRLYNAKNGKQIGKARVRRGEVKLPTRMNKYEAVWYRFGKSAARKYYGQTVRFTLGGRTLKTTTILNKNGTITIEKECAAGND